MHSKRLQNRNRTNHRERNSQKTYVMCSVGKHANGGCQEAYERKQYRPRHPARKFRVAKQFVGHDNKGRKQEKSQISCLCRRPRGQYKSRQRENPKFIFGWRFEAVNSLTLFFFFRQVNMRIELL